MNEMNITEITAATPKETIDALLEHAENGVELGYHDLPVVTLANGRKYTIATNGEDCLNAALTAMESDDSIADYSPAYIAQVTGLNEEKIAELIESEDENSIDELRDYLCDNAKMLEFAVAVGRDCGFGPYLGLVDGKEVKLECGYRAYWVKD